MITQPILKIASWICLALVILPSLLSFSDLVSLPLVKTLALLGTIGWFLCTPIWMSRSVEDKTDGATI